MPDTAIIPVLLTAITGLVAAVVYLYKRGEKREKEHRIMITDLIHKNNILTERMSKVLDRVEELLKNWRAR